MGTTTEDPRLDSHQGQRFILFPEAPKTGCGAHPAFVAMGIGGFIRLVRELHLVLRSEVWNYTPPLPPHLHGVVLN